MYGHARVSNIDQVLSIQRAALKASGLQGDPRREDERHPSDGRAERHALLALPRADATLVVTPVDRLA
jgi:DNA invertase Pin-like site-specific DNA recombinase